MRPQPRDPRTVARDIPGICDALFPQIAPGVIAHLNRSTWSAVGCQPISDELVDKSELQHAMLFELAVAAGEQLVGGADEVDIGAALKSAVSRQRKHFDAMIPKGLSGHDSGVIISVAKNLRFILTLLQSARGESQIVTSPSIPGFSWISSGLGDFSIGESLVEVKCTGKPFGSADLRQVLMYWLLSYASAIEGAGSEWSEIIFVNPRKNSILELDVNTLLAIVGAGRTKVELFELFSALVGKHSMRMLGSS